LVNIIITALPIGFWSVSIYSILSMSKQLVEEVHFQSWLTPSQSLHEMLVHMTFQYVVLPIVIKKYFNMVYRTNLQLLANSNCLGAKRKTPIKFSLLQKAKVVFSYSKSESQLDNKAKH
jgi:hypothetical protein